VKRYAKSADKNKCELNLILLFSKFVKAN